ncbi:DNA cytosine methyltransferase [Actinomadura latina]|uniref:DNA cytosine methyltransferase n=2 Tax=Actinomadura latina TaxID=163603 RepID=A0A846YTU4_9ACTN|nr:DNA cytosine methyltransferase [Actinomadura latina]NKZ03157.1 DNA cytosine methyltransferase [Actinomadura latina]
MQSDIKVLVEAGDTPEPPRDVALTWVSFPCTDLSLVGGRKGLPGEHSSTFYDLMKIRTDLGQHQPPVVALENVNGFATSHDSKDREAAVQVLNGLSCPVNILSLDARSVAPQLRRPGTSRANKPCSHGHWRRRLCERDGLAG